MSTLREPPVRDVLDRLHEAAKGDRSHSVRLVPSFLIGRLRGKSLSEIVTPERMKDCYMPVSREQGEFLYLEARSLSARRVVEFGSSFGISTIYLAAAVRDNGGGEVVGTEIEPSKHATAVANLEEAGLGDLVDIRLGDAMETLREVPGPVDMVLLDGWQDLYLAVLELLRPRLQQGAVVLADNIFTFRKDLRPYVEFVQAGTNGFESTTLHISDGFEYSVFVADGE